MIPLALLPAAVAATVGPALRLAPWGLALAAGATALWYRGAWLGCRADAALAVARAEQQIAAARSADLAASHALEARLRPLVHQLQEQSHATSLALARIVSDPRCAHTPAAAAFDGSLRAGERSAARPTGAGGARPAGP